MAGDFGQNQIVYVVPDKDDHKVINTIIHESVHVFQHAMAYVNELSWGKEQTAYHIAEISETLIREYSRQMNIRNLFPEEKQCPT